MGVLFKTEALVKDYLVGGQVVHALNGVSVEVERGEFLAVMGPSGSGKSTFMNLLGCLDKPSSGRYILDGKEVSSLSPKDLARTRNRKIGFVFQNFNLLRRTTALENVALPLIYARTPRRKRREKAEEVLSAVGLSDRIHHQPAQLSGGQQQRVAIARALVNDPDLILADEPTGALDTQTGLELMRLFQELNSKGITIVLVTHENDIAGFARRILRFRDGRMTAGEMAVNNSEGEHKGEIAAGMEGSHP
ncbi:MAG: ABC transporter ATP-binding protein [Deltaproteobacteria bacterium]|nr:ABC transporter ATP-binding protein [Deltaproteobacteria bacterium]